MIKRELYLSKIRPFYDSDLIKVIVGIRRAGKSTIMMQIIDELKDNLVIEPFNKKEENGLLNIKIKNKIFEKIRKLFDEYSKYDENIILADIVSPEYFGNVDDIIKFNDEITFYINHLEENFDEKDYILILKIGEKIGKIDLKKHTYEVL